MTVNLYMNSSASNTLYKRYTQVGTGITAQIKGVCDVERPTLILNWKGTGFNYIQVPDFSRYYHVLSITALPGNMTQITCQSDPLESVASQIAEREALAVRNEDKTKWDKDEPDPMIINRAKRTYRGYAFGSMQNVHSNTDATYILGVI